MCILHIVPLWFLVACYEWIIKYYSSCVYNAILLFIYKLVRHTNNSILHLGEIGHLSSQISKGVEIKSGRLYHNTMEAKHTMPTVLSFTVKLRKQAVRDAIKCIDPYISCLKRPKCICIFLQHYLPARGETIVFCNVIYFFIFILHSTRLY